MNNSTITFLVRLSHHWDGAVLASTAALIVAATVAVRVRKGLRSSDSPRTRIATLVAIGLCGLATLSGILLLLACMHLGCAALVSQEHECRWNLRLTGSAVQMYAEDYDERLPPGSYWVDAITPALKKSEATADARPHSADPFKCPAVDSGPGYARNSTSGGIRLADVSAPADYVLVFDALARGADSHGVRLLNGGPELFAKYRHSSSNILFCDGHVKGLNLNVSQLGWAPTDVPKR